MAETGLLGRPTWYELMTTDPKGAESFYTAVAGWRTQPFNEAGAGAPYQMWMRGEVPVGGLMELPADARQAGAPPHWLMYLGTPDVDDTVRRAQSLGARVLMPATEVPTVGRFAVLADPQGAVFAAFTPAEPMPDSDAAPAEGDFSWLELMTTDESAAFRFYSDLFGWNQTEAMDMGPMGIYRMFGRAGGRPLGGMYNRPPEVTGPPHWLLYVKVDNVHRVTEVVKAQGGQILHGPMEVPGGDWITQCLDPQGAAFAIHHSHQ